MSKARAPSLINLRHSRTDADFLVNLVHGVLSQHLAELEAGYIITVDDGSIRLHQLPIGSTH